MTAQSTLTEYLNDYLACDTFEDYAPNGLQIEGRAVINRICTAVTASEAIIKEAVLQKADALFVHHGYFWRGESAVITGMKRRRIGELIAHNINLYAYHLPLDCHPLIGNNACLGQLLSVFDVKMHIAGKTKNLLWSGVLQKPLLPEIFLNSIAKKLDRTPLHVTGTEKPIHRIAWCSGAAQDFIEDAHRLEVDAYLSGEISERTYYQAKELGIHYFAIGHHASERYGIQALGQHLAHHYELEHSFIDSVNPV